MGGSRNATLCLPMIASMIRRADRPSHRPADPPGIGSGCPWDARLSDFLWAGRSAEGQPVPVGGHDGEVHRDRLGVGLAVLALDDESVVAALELAAGEVVAECETVPARTG